MGFRGFRGSRRGRLGLVACLPFALLPLVGEAGPAEEGKWSEVLEWPVSATHSHLLPTGKVMFFGEFDEGLEPPQLWDPKTGKLSDLPKADFNIFCAGHSFLADGRLLLTGGHVESHVGVKHVRIFDPFTLKWSKAPDMNDNRWYPTNTTLPNGDVVILSGETHEAGMTNPLPQVWQAETNTLRDLVTAERTLPYYPRMFLAPNGKLFFAGPWRVNRWLDTEGTGTWFDSTRSLHGGRDYGAAVMYDTKVLIVGGGKPPTEKAEEIDLAAPSPTWRYVAPMRYPRRQLNATLLPDGTTLVTGGSSGATFDDATKPILYPELYDPATNTWKRLAPAAEYRGYHSTALLLPDGRVMTGGGRHRQSAQIFSPPYL
ncbi:MAG TPA: hypothetical protein VLQ93_11690, partial [Myxococcaceae bacterium]|nr:hypothetical protein [Myxococcaceae bacterium]